MELNLILFLEELHQDCLKIRKRIIEKEINCVMDDIENEIVEKVLKKISNLCDFLGAKVIEVMGNKNN